MRSGAPDSCSYSASACAFHGEMVILVSERHEIRSHRIDVDSPAELFELLVSHLEIFGGELGLRPSGQDPVEVRHVADDVEIGVELRAGARADRRLDVEAGPVQGARELPAPRRWPRGLPRHQLVEQIGAKSDEADDVGVEVTQQRVPAEVVDVRLHLVNPCNQLSPCYSTTS